MVKIDDAAYERSAEDADTPEIEQIDGPVRRHRVIAEMRVTVNDPVMVERHIPNPEHPQRDLVAFRQRRFSCNVKDRRPIEPGHCQQPAGRKLGQRYRDGDTGNDLARWGAYP